MKTKLKKILKVFIKLIVFFVHPFFVKVITFLLNEFTTSFIVKQLKKCGKDPVILFPITAFGLKYISIGNNFKSCSRLRIEAHDRYLNDTFSPEIIIGNNVSINYDCHIACVNKIIIGDNVLMASKIFITDHFHGDTKLDNIKKNTKLKTSFI